MRRLSSRRLLRRLRGNGARKGFHSGTLRAGEVKHSYGIRRFLWDYFNGGGYRKLMEMGFVGELLWHSGGLIGRFTIPREGYFAVDGFAVESINSI